ncbi:MAG: hypothetical protein CL872_03775 [Dehalococcoidaceae bacterium]|nr:hypothetical protein [Dehalococcoidaceae bacterium]
MYKIGVIGTSWAARSPLPTFQTYKGVEVVAICSGKVENARKCAKEFNIPDVEKNYIDLCRRNDIDIIYIGSPVNLHKEMFVEAAKNKKHIICEKPLSLNLHEAELMSRAARNNNIESIVAFTMRHFDSHFALKKIIAKGKIGDPLHISINDFRGVPFSTSPPQFNWWHQKNKGGGILSTMGSHFIDLTRYIIADFDQVFATLKSMNTRAIDSKNKFKKITSDDMFNLQGKLKSDTSVSINCSIATNVRLGSNRSIEIFGSKGSLSLVGDEISPEGVELFFTSNKNTKKQKINIPKIPMTKAAQNSSVPRFGLMIDKLIKSIKGNRQGPNVYDGLMCQKVIDAAHYANESGKLSKIK